MCKYCFQTNLFLKNNLLGKALNPPFFVVLSSDLKQTNFFHKKNSNIDYSSSFLYLIDVNWLYISCKVTKEKCSAESSKQDDCYLMLLKVQYGSSHFRIF